MEAERPGSLNDGIILADDTSTWRVAQNQNWRVYYGEKRQGIIRTRAVIVVDDDENILYQDRQSVFGRLAEWLTKLATG